MSCKFKSSTAPKPPPKKNRRRPPSFFPCVCLCAVVGRKRLLVSRWLAFLPPSCVSRMSSLRSLRSLPPHFEARVKSSFSSPSLSTADGCEKEGQMDSRARKSKKLVFVFLLLLVFSRPSVPFFEALRVFLRNRLSSSFFSIKCSGRGRESRGGGREDREGGHCRQRRRHRGGAALPLKVPDGRLWKK